MALIKSTILAQISGSINGLTFAHNKGGAYARNRSLPSNPGTDRQDQVRTAMTALSKMWAEYLSPAQRDQWSAYGGSVTVLNRIGDPIQLSGINAYIRVNLFRMATLGLAAVSDPPDPVGNPDAIPSYQSSNITNEEGDVTINVETTALLSSYGIIFYYSPPISPGIRYYRGPYAGFAAASNIAADVASLLLPATYVAGMNVGFKVICYNEQSLLKVWEVFIDPIIIGPAV